jgi:hypothetical protein
MAHTWSASIIPTPDTMKARPTTRVALFVLLGMLTACSSTGSSASDSQTAPGSAKPTPLSMKGIAAKGAAAPEISSKVALSADVLAQASMVSGLVERLNARTMVTYRLRLESGVEHHILVQGDGDTDLDAVLLNRSGDAIAADRDSTDFCILSVVPSYTGEFTLEIYNLGNVFNQYVITVL